MPKFDKGESAIMEKEAFSIDDAEKIVKSALGGDALKRADKMTDSDITEEEYKKYEEADKLPPDIRNIWWKAENERAQIWFLANNEAQQEGEESGGLAEILREKDDILSEAQKIILKEKVPDKIIKAFDELTDDYKSKLNNNDFLKESGDENAEKVSNSLKAAINELTNFKNQVKFITSNNNTNFMPESSSKEISSIINIQNNNDGEEVGRIADEELAQEMANKANEMHKEWKDKIEDASNKEINETIGPAADKAMEDVFINETGVKYEIAVQEAMKDMKGTEDEINKEVDNNDGIVNDRASDIKDDAVRNEIIGDNDEAKQNMNNEVSNLKVDAERKIGEIDPEPPSKEPIQEKEKEIKDEKIESAKKDIGGKIKSIDGKIQILENSHGNPYDRRLYIAREAGIDIKQLTPKEEGRQKLIILARRKAEKDGLLRVEEIVNNPEIKNWDELQNRLWDNYKSAKSEFVKKCEELDNEPKDSNRRKKLIEEKRDLQSKMQMAKDSVADFDGRAAEEKAEKDKKRQMRNQKSVKPEPAGKPQESKAVEPIIADKSPDIQPDSQPKQSDREEIAAAYDQRIANLRLGIDEAKASGDKNEVARLERFARELEHEKKWRIGKADTNDQGRNINKNPKTKVQNKDAQAPKDKTAEPNNYNQEWQSLHEQIKQAEKDGKGEEVRRLVQEIYKLEQNKRNEEAAARDKDREKKRIAQERKKEAQKMEQIAEIKQRIANLRLGIAEAGEAENEPEVLRLENALREVEQEKLQISGKADKKTSKGEKENAMVDIDPLLRETLYNKKERTIKRQHFEKTWHERWHPRGVKEGYFQTEKNESPFSKYSSRGWKIHIAFEKGQEQEIARFLYENGLYFKVEAGHGTYFNGLKESGATIYIGSSDNMSEIANFMEANIGKFLKDGAVAKAGDKIIHVGSGSDIEVCPGITARFDVAKTEVGWLEGNKKYTEYGLPTWTGLGGIPMLTKHEKEAADIISKWNNYTPDQRDFYYERKLKPIYEESKSELMKDFGHEFLLGKRETVGEAEAEVKTEENIEASKNPTELENDIVETNHKTIGPVYTNENTPEDALDEAEKIKNGKKAKKAAGDIKDEEKNQEPAKEKTAEEILREKNIEVYGGAEKLNQIFEDYKRLNDLEDKKAYYNDNPLFSEWDALRVKIANINLESFGKDRTVDLYKIQNKDEMIREYFNAKLEEPLEDFQKDIQKASPNELAIRAATLIKYRNELKNCDWQGKDKYRDVPRKEYLEIIKILEQKIEILNGALPKKEDASPEAALKDLSIDDFEKIEKAPEYKGGYPAVIEAGPKIELTNEQSARVEKILKDFDLTAEDAEKIEGFKDLSYGQRLLALQNLRQLTLRDVRIGAVETQKEETAQTKGFFRKVWKSIKKRYDIAKHEKSIANNLNKEDYAATLAQLARGMKELKTDVVEKNGRLEFQYVSGLENLTPEQAARVQRFNEVASELSKLPMEWTADDSKKGFFRQMMDKAGLGQAWSPDDPTRSQYRRTGELNAEFQSLKQEVVRIIKQQKDSDLKKAGVEKFDDLETQSHATAQMLQIENLLRCNRAMNVNPDAEKALLEIKSAPLWKRALNNIATEKGIYFVAGFAARSVSVSLLGTAGIIGGAAGMGGYMGYKRGKETLRENDALAQHKDFEETKKKRIEKFQRAKQGKAGQAGEAEKTEKRIEDANVLARNLNNFVEYIKEEDDPKRRMDLSRRLRDRVKFVKDALDQGRINFGSTGERAASLYELTDKLNDAVNCVEIYHPSTRHEADQWSEANQSEVMEKLNQYLAESKIELDAERRKYLVKQLAKGALYGAGFASAGMIARELFSHLDPHLFNAQGETDLGVRWISGSGSGKPLVGGIVGKYMHGEPDGGGGGGSIPPHEAGMPAGTGSGKSAYEALMGNKPKDYDMFPWQKSTESIQEIPMGQGSFAERFLRAVGMHEGSPVKPDLQKIVAEYTEYFRSHPDLLKNNNSSSEYLNHLKSDLQSAGLDGRAADSIVKNFSTEMGKVGTGIYPEGEALPGIETTGGGGNTAEQAAAAAGVGKTVEAVAGAKQDILSSAVETASGKMNSVWKMIDHQLDQRGVFKGLTGTPEEIAAKKDHLIDYFKDIVAKNPGEFGLKNADTLQDNQKVDLSKLFENQSGLGQAFRDANTLSTDKIASILENRHNISNFHHLHPDVHITSENVDQIAAGHGEALLKKAVEQAASEQVQSSAPEMPIQSEASRVAPAPWDSHLKQEYQTMVPEEQAEAAAKQAADRQLNEIFKYPFGRQGAETMTYQDIKNGSAEGFLKRDFFKEMAGNHDLDISEKDALMHDIPKYENLQKHLNNLIQKSGGRPRAGETVDQFINRANHNIATAPEYAIPETVADKAIPPHDTSQKLEIDKDFFKEKPASSHETVKAAADIGHTAQAKAVNNFKISTDKFSGDIKFKYDAGGNPTEMMPIDHYELHRITGSEYFDKTNLKSFDAFAKTAGKDLAARVEIFKELNSEQELKESGVVIEEIKKIITRLDKNYGKIVDYSKLPQEIRERMGK